MAFLSRYSLTLPEARALRLTDTYSLHRIVYDLFPLRVAEATPAERDILYADKGGDARQRRLLILSGRQPRTPEHGQLECRSIPDALFGFTAYRFEIILNPARRNGGTGKIIPVRGREAIAAWFLEKAPEWGFAARPHTLLVTNDHQDSFIKNGHTVTLNKATVTGFLDVTNSAVFAHAVLAGIGRARAFGCGLLQLTPAL